jgi:hypothetical protein
LLLDGLEKNSFKLWMKVSTWMKVKIKKFKKTVDGWNILIMDENTSKWMKK